MSWDLCRTNFSGCNSNSCMKLSFESGECQGACRAGHLPAEASRPVAAAADDTGGGVRSCGRGTAGRKWRPRFFAPESEETPPGLQNCRPSARMTQTLEV